MPVHALPPYPVAHVEKREKRRGRHGERARRLVGDRRGAARRVADAPAGRRAPRPTPGAARAGGRDGDAHRGVAVRRAGVDRPHRRRRRSATPAPQVNISESLGGVAGLLARDRQNYAQDVQISVRGFGARSTFGIRGVRLYVDGIPATLPDGQGQITNVDLGSADRIEVLRGPFSALYGNSSGGVIQVFTEEGSGPPTVGAGVAGGSYGALRFGAKASGGDRRLRLRRQRQHLPHRRLPRAQRGRAQHRQRQAHLAARRRQQA